MFVTLREGIIQYYATELISHFLQGNAGQGNRFKAGGIPREARWPAEKTPSSWPSNRIIYLKDENTCSHIFIGNIWCTGINILYGHLGIVTSPPMICDHSFGYSIAFVLGSVMKFCVMLSFFSPLTQSTLH